MNIIRNSIIIIHDYEYDTIANIQSEAVSFWTRYYDENCEITEPIVSNILPSIFNKEYTLIISGDCALDSNLKDQITRDRRSWCNHIYNKYLPQNIVVVNVGDGKESFIEYQLPKRE